MATVPVGPAVPGVLVVSLHAPTLSPVSVEPVGPVRCVILCRHRTSLSIQSVPQAPEMGGSGARGELIADGHRSLIAAINHTLAVLAAREDAAAVDAYVQVA